MTSQQYSMIRLLERVFCVLSLMFLMGALEPFISTWGIRRSVDTGAGSLKFQILSLSFYSIGTLVVLVNYRRLGPLLMGNLLIVALIGWVLLSSLWSIFPEASLRRGIALLLTTIFAFYLVMRFTPRELVTLLGWALLAAIALSFFFALFTSWGKHSFGPHTGTWRGTFSHKNEFGRYMAFGLLTFLVLLGGSRGPLRGLWLVGCVGSGVLLVLSRSATSLALAAGLLAAWPLLKALRAGRLPITVKVPIVVFLGFGGMVFLIGSFFVEGLEALGRDATLSGRTKIWMNAIAAGMQHPWVGAGYRVFWTDVGSRNVMAHIGWDGALGNGHNGYLDTWLELGFVGLSLMLATVVLAARRVWSRLVTTRDGVGLWYAQLLAFLVIYSVTELVILEQSNLIWALYLVTLIYLTPRRLPQPVAQPLGHPAAARLGRA